MKLTFVSFIVSLLTPVIHSDTTVTIYREWLAKGGRYRYDRDRWNKHNGLEPDNLIPNCRSIGTESGRWIHPDYAGNLFPDWPEDPHRQGYPDPNYLKNVSRQQEFFAEYLENINSGHYNSMVADERAFHWPSWINQSEHNEQFPNNLDAASEFMVLMMQGIYDYTKGQIPRYFEVMNEPDGRRGSKVFNFSTVSLFHKIVAEKFHSKFDINIAGPTLTAYSASLNLQNFTLWKQVANFIDVTNNQLDIFSFHAYNGLIVSGNSHSFFGMNEARLVAFVDLVENYYINKFGRVMPLLISEYGRSGLKGINDTSPSGIIEFATIYQANAHRFTHLGLREHIDRSVVFLAANGQYPGHDSLNYSLFTKDGKATRLVDVFKFWFNFTSDYRFLRTTSSYDSKVRLISPLVLSNPSKNETIILLHSYSQDNQTVTLNFQQDWNIPPTGEAMCITLMDNWYPNITYYSFDLTKSNGKVNIRPEETCQFKFKTSFNPTALATVNETTHYGSDMVIPVDQELVKTTIITLPHDGFYTAKLRVGITIPANATKQLTKVTLNSQVLNSFYMLYDSDKLKPDINIIWNVWEFSVPSSLPKPGNNVVRIYFSNSETGVYVSSVALVTGVIVPTKD